MINPRPLRYLLPVGGALFTGAFGVATYVTRQMNGPRRLTRADHFTFTPFEFQVPYETVTFRTHDALSIRGWWLPQAEGDRVIIACHGHRGAKHELLGIGSTLWRAGNSVLLFDFRGCGDSDRAISSLAFNEVADALGAIEYARRRLPAAKIGLLGYSMGAAVAIIAAADSPEVAAVAADSPFADIRGILAHAFKRSRVPIHPFMDLTDVVNRRRYGYSLDAVRPIGAVGRIAPRPLLLMHGGRDATTPVEHAHRLFQAAGEPKELWIDDEAEHCGAYFRDRAGYSQRVRDFFQRTLTSEDEYGSS